MTAKQRRREPVVFRIADNRQAWPRYWQIIDRMAKVHMDQAQAVAQHLADSYGREVYFYLTGVKGGLGWRGSASPAARHAHTST